MHLSIIIPAYNEETNLNKNINKYDEYLNRQSYDYEIIIVNDGSIDNTEKIAKEIALKNKKIKLINNKTNKGKGFAVRTGLLLANGDYRLFIDADGATSINHLDKIWPYFKNNNDIIIGSRNAKDATGAHQAKPQALWKRLFGIFGNYFIQFLTIKGINDTQCGFKILTKKSALEIIPKMKINRWLFDVEMLTIARTHGSKIAIIPVEWINSSNSRVGIKGYFSSLKDIAKIKYNLITGKYN